MFGLDHILTATALLTSLSLLLSAIGAVVAFFQRGGGDFNAFLRYLFPREMWTRRSCYQDAGFIVIKQLIRPFVAAPLLLLTMAECARYTYKLLSFGLGPHPQAPVPVLLFAVLLIGAVLIQDFFRFGSHCLLHKSGALWDVHKVHHSADFLTPLTNHRVHIIEEIIQQAMTGLSVGPFLAFAAYFTSTSISTSVILGFDAYVLIDTLSFGMLRHSHIGLSYGRLERVFLSPKQHHLHHSVEQRHWDKNFGFLFAFWDRMAGTICFSDPKETIRFGITGADLSDCDSVLKLHFMPYLELYRRIRSAKPEAPGLALTPPRSGRLNTLGYAIKRRLFMSA
jgi:sterol desaturase/sphingolipid hydroxylase (fatty acid hydroxylase superfamily)